jgi:hypothetical protein
MGVLVYITNTYFYFRSGAMSRMNCSVFDFFDSSLRGRTGLRTYPEKSGNTRDTMVERGLMAPDWFPLLGRLPSELNPSPNAIGTI